MSPRLRFALVAALVLRAASSTGGPATKGAGEGDRGAHPASAALATTGQWRQGFVLADLNGDGALDLAHGPPRAADGRPRLFLNDGRGGLRPWAEARFPELPLDYGDAAAADFDGDGRADLAFGSHLGRLTVLLGDGAGGFRPAAGGAMSNGEAAFASVALETADWDGDGRTDLLALGEGPRPGGEPSYGLRVYRNLAGGWTTARGDDPGRLFGDHLAVGDFNGDGRPDAFAASRSTAHRGQVFLGRGEEGWQLARPEMRRGAYVLSVAACDLDGDGREELLAGFLERHGAVWRHGIDRLDWDPESDWRRTAVSETAGNELLRSLACADLDRDGRKDLLAGSSTGEITLRGGRSDGGFRKPRTVVRAAQAQGCGVRHLALGDLDGDGHPELIASFSQEAKDTCPPGGALKLWHLH